MHARQGVCDVSPCLMPFGNPPHLRLLCMSSCACMPLTAGRSRGKDGGIDREARGQSRNRCHVRTTPSPLLFSSVHNSTDIISYRDIKDRTQATNGLVCRWTYPARAENLLPGSLMTSLMCVSWVRVLGRHVIKVESVCDKQLHISIHTEEQLARVSRARMIAPAMPPSTR